MASGPTFQTVKPGLPNIGPKPPAVPKPSKGAIGGTLTFPTPTTTLKPSVPQKGSAIFPASPGGAIPPQTTPAAAGTGSAASSGSGSTAASPLDSTYFDNIAANNFKVGNQINSLTSQGQNLNTNLTNALAQLAYQQPRDNLKLEQNANKAGALYSSVYDQNLGNLNNTYQTKQSGLVDTNAQKQAQLSSEIGGLQQGIPIYNSAQYDDAVARAAKAAATNPASGQPAIPTASTVGSVLATAAPGRSATKAPARSKSAAPSPVLRGGQRYLTAGAANSVGSGNTGSRTSIAAPLTKSGSKWGVGAGGSALVKAIAKKGKK